MRVTKDSVKHMTLQAIARTIRCVATLREDTPDVLQLMPLLLNLVLRDAKYISPGDSAQIIWAIGVLDLRGEEVGFLMRSMRAQLVKKLRERAFAIVEVSCMLWGLACLGERDEEVLSTAATELADVVASLPDQDAVRLPRAVCAMARLRFRSTDLLGAVASRLWEMLPLLDSWSLWALQWTFMELDI